MKTFETRIALFLGTILFGLGLSIGERQALADPIKNCPTQKCKTVSCWLAVSTSPPTILWAQVAGGADATTYRILGLYSPASTETTPSVQSGTFDRYTYTTYTPTCDKLPGDPNYPVPQEVTPGGTKALDQAGVTRWVCTYSP
jgi:hypothetical protein